MIYENVLESIGNTPHIRLNRLYDPRVSVWAKLERQNPGGSIKDRIGLAMIEDAEARGVLGPDSVIIEPTSGNTGIGLALVAAVKGYRVILVMPESMSVERRKLMQLYGAELDLTPRELGMKGAIARAREIADETPGAWIPMQFDNPANVDVHRRTTAEEIARDFPEGLDYIVTGVGHRRPHHGRRGGPQAALAEPEGLRGGADAVAGPVGRDALAAPDPGHRRRVHPGRSCGRSCSTGSSRSSPPTRSPTPGARAREEGLLIGPSSGASLAAVAQLLPQVPDGSRILAITYDTGERYLSVDLLFG